MIHIVSIALGSNLGDKKENINRAICLIKQFSTVIKHAKLYMTEPWGYNTNNNYLNTGVTIETEYSPFQLLKKLKEIEKKMGRIKLSDVYEDRIIDLDILTFDNLKISSKELIIPHPKIAERKFSIVILKDLYLNELIPGFKVNAQCLLEKCEDKQEVQLFNEV